MIRRTALWALLAVGAGCGGAKSRGSVPGDETSTAVQLPDVGEIRFELLDAGAEPRSPLRYDWSAVRNEKMVIEIKMDVSTNDLEQTTDWVGDAWVEQPTMRFSSLVTPGRRTPQGDLGCRLVTQRVDVLQDAKIDADIRENLTEHLAKLVGASSEAVVTPRGIAKRAEVLSAPGMTAMPVATEENVLSMIRQTLVRFPAEAVGVGAKWKTTSTLQSKSFHFVEVASLRLVSKTKDQATVEFEFEERAPERPIDKPVDIGRERTMTLEKHEGHGKGRITVDLGHLVARGEQECERRGTFKVESPGYSMTMSKAFKVKSKFGPP